MSTFGTEKIDKMFEEARQAQQNPYPKYLNESEI